jgi:hypothetical protein
MLRLGCGVPKLELIKRPALDLALRWHYAPGSDGTSMAFWRGTSHRAPRHVKPNRITQGVITCCF